MPVPNKEELKAKEQMRKLGRWRQIFATLAATMGVFSLGTVMAWTYGPDILSNPTENELMLLFLTPALGGALAGPIGGVAIERFGRKRTMVMVSVPIVLGWILVGIGYHLIMTLVGRFLTGFGSGVSLLAAVAYVSEISEDSRRGSLLCFVQLMIFSGYLFMDILSNVISAKSLAYICGIFPAIYLSMVVYCPESPRFLVGRGRVGEAAKCLSWFRATHAQDSITEELQSIHRSLDAAKSRTLGCCSQVCIRPVLKPFLISMILMIMVEMSGFTTILAHRQFLLARNGIHLNSNLLLIIMGTTLLICTGICTLLVDRMGRRLLLIFSGTLTTAALATLGTYYFISEAQVGRPESHRAMRHGWIPVTSFFGYIFGFSLGIGPLPWVVMGEILPPNSKGYYLAPFVSSYFIASLALNSKWNSIKSMDMYWRFWIYASFCFVSTIFLLCTVPETKKKSLSKIEQFFAPKRRSKSAKLTAMSMTCRNISSPEMTTLMAKPGAQTPYPHRVRM